MQENTSAISVFGYRSQKMNTFMNKQTNVMGLQFGRDDCQKMLNGKRHRNSDICQDGKVDAWEDVVHNDEHIDNNVGKEAMRNVEDKTYIEQIIQNNGKHYKNIKDKVNEAVGSVNRIV